MLTLFHHVGKRVTLGRRADGSPFGHAFGGSAGYAGLSTGDGQPPVHLLLRLNTADPAVGVTLPEADWLPLLCAIRFGACALGYRVVSNREVRILHRAERQAWDTFPFDNYPEALPTSPVVLEEGKYDPADPRDALGYGAVFGYDALTPEQFATAARYAEGTFGFEIFSFESGEEYLREGNCLPYQQGRPSGGCPDPACVNHRAEAPLRTFAIFREECENSRNLWGPDCGSLQIIHMICPLCSAIFTVNQSD